MFQKAKTGAAAFRARLSALCPEREIFLRSGGQVKFIRITRRAQLTGIAIMSTALIGWGAVTLSMIANTVSVAQDSVRLSQQGKAVASSASKVAEYRKSVEDLAHDLEARQDFVDDLYKTHFGTDEGNASDVDLVGTAKTVQKSPLAAKISMAPEAASLVRLAERQRHFAVTLTTAVERRADRAAAAIRSFGLNPDRLARSASSAQGGPFVPWKGDRGAMTGELEELASALDRMERLERSLLSLPSGKPTAAPMQTSSYGYRRDPFNGRAAFHAGIDFPGSYGQPILSAAGGKIGFVGQRQGYGNVVEVDHGNGIMTRYAHLSRFTAKVGDTVVRGDTIGRMGSTGRSTGTHLHFEVRLNGQAINPRRFLEARTDVLQVQQIAKARVADVRNRG